MAASGSQKHKETKMSESMMDNSNLSAEAKEQQQRASLLAETIAEEVFPENDGTAASAEPLQAAPETIIQANAESSSNNSNTINKSDGTGCGFQMGDHVYQWCSFAGIPAVYSHHGIVMDVFWEPSDELQDRGAPPPPSQQEQQQPPNINSNNEERGQWMLTIADFSNWQDDEDKDTNAVSTDHTSSSATAEESSATIDSTESTVGAASVASHNTDCSWNSQHPHPHKPPRHAKSIWGRSSSRKSSGGFFRVYDCPAFDIGKKNKRKPLWRKVTYRANWLQRHWHRSGTCTAVSSDAPGLVRARVQFLLEQSRRDTPLPKYNAVHSNCECVAVWCKTGTWATLQASSFLAVAAAGQAKSAVTIAGAVSAAQVTVPAAGAWGWLGYTTHVSLASTQPYLLPAIAAYGVVTAGAPACWLARAQRAWKEVSERLNAAFWEHAVAHPDVFVECLTQWSAQYEPEETQTPMELKMETNETVLSSAIKEIRVDDNSTTVEKADASSPPPSPQAAGQQSEEADRSTTRIKEAKIPSVLMV